MSVLAPAVGAVLAAILESSVLTHLQVGSVRPDLVFAMGIAVAMVLGFESGMTWAFVGGISLEIDRDTAAFSYRDAAGRLLRVLPASPRSR